MLFSVKYLQNRTMKNLNLGLIVAFLFSQISVHSQLTVDSSQPINLVIQNLLGPNVQFSNVTFSGDFDQI